MTYYPDYWIVLHVWGNPEHYRVLAGFKGSYTESDSWRLNSGIKKIEKQGDHWLFHGHSGSIYSCHIDRYGMNTLMAGVWNKLSNEYGDLAKILPESEISQITS